MSGGYGGAGTSGGGSKLRYEPLLLLEQPAHQGGVSISEGTEENPERKLAVCGNQLCTLTELQSGGTLSRMSRDARLRCVALSRTGALLVVGGFDKKVVLNYVEKGAAINQYIAYFKSSATGDAADAARAACGGSAGAGGAATTVRSVHLSADSARLAIGSDVQGRARAAVRRRHQRAARGVGARQGGVLGAPLAQRPPAGRRGVRRQDDAVRRVHLLPAARGAVHVDARPAVHLVDRLLRRQSLPRRRQLERLVVPLRDRRARVGRQARGRARRRRARRHQDPHAALREERRRRRRHERAGDDASRRLRPRRRARRQGARRLAGRARVVVARARRARRPAAPRTGQGGVGGRGGGGARARGPRVRRRPRRVWRAHGGGWARQDGGDVPLRPGGARERDARADVGGDVRRLCVRRRAVGRPAVLRLRRDGEGGRAVGRAVGGCRSSR